MLLSGVSAGLPPDGVRKGRGRSNLIWRGCRACAKHHRAEMRPDPIHRPGGDAASGRGCYPARKPSNASPFAPQRTAERFFVRLSGVSPPRPKLGKAPRAASVNAGRKATAAGGAERGVDGREHGAIVDKAGPLMPLPPLPHRRARCQPACGAGSRPASWPGPLLPSACLRAWRASPPSSSRRRL